MKILKIIFIGLITTMTRILVQWLIPAGSQNILLPSKFALNNTLPVVFSIYGLFAYSLIASMFLLVCGKMSGRKIIQGLKYGLSCSVIWVVYLLEPLPHVAMLDCITYPLADSLVLIVMGALCGLLLGENKKIQPHKSHFSLLSILTIMSCFILARYVLYLFYDIYSSFDTYPLPTLWWCILSSSVISCVIMWLNDYVDEHNFMKRSLVLGGILFGIDLTLFNFFMPLVFEINIADLLLRTISDIAAVTVGCVISQKVTSFTIQKGCKE